MRARANRELGLIMAFLLLAGGFRLYSRSLEGESLPAAPEKFVELKQGEISYLIPLGQARTAAQIDHKCPDQKLAELDRVTINGGCRIEQGAASNFARLAAGKKMLINSAGADEFKVITGVGKARAEKILALREKMGGFKSREDLKELKWFNPEMAKETERYFAISEHD
jgi:competence ComEA-like helix-hairpin-helix protein